MEHNIQKSFSFTVVSNLELRRGLESVWRRVQSDAWSTTKHEVSDFAHSEREEGSYIVLERFQQLHDTIFRTVSRSAGVLFGASWPERTRAHSACIRARKGAQQAPLAELLPRNIQIMLVNFLTRDCNII